MQRGGETEGWSAWLGGNDMKYKVSIKTDGGLREGHVIVEASTAKAAKRKALARPMVGAFEKSKGRRFIVKCEKALPPNDGTQRSGGS